MNFITVRSAARLSQRRNREGRHPVRSRLARALAPGVTNSTTSPNAATRSPRWMRGYGAARGRMPSKLYVAQSR